MLSLEPWDDVWRRNQHLAARLVRDGTISSLVFVTPPTGGLAIRSRRCSPLARVQVLTPPLVVPRRYGGHAVLARWLRRALADVDLLWINDPVAGLGALRPGLPAVYDVTDDWREMAQVSSGRHRLVRAEDALARLATTVVCSQVLADRWKARYGVEATVIQNGVDIAAIRAGVRRTLDGQAPHAVYVGTLHANRLDVDLVRELADSWPGTVHLVGPDHLDIDARESLMKRGVRIHGPVPAADVPSWMVSADVLICPHVVDGFTLSLDAIKSHEYLATDRPVVATASSGFQSLEAPGLFVAARAEFADAVVSAADSGPHRRDVAADWSDRVDAFEAVVDRTTAVAGRNPAIFHNDRLGESGWQLN